MSLRSSSQQPAVIYVNAIGSSRESNSSCRICHLSAVPLGHVADKGQERSSMQPKQSPEQPSALTNCFISPSLICNVFPINQTVVYIFSPSFIVFLDGDCFLTQCTSCAPQSSSIKKQGYLYCDLIVFSIDNSPFSNLHKLISGDRSISIFQAQP